MPLPSVVRNWTRTFNTALAGGSIAVQAPTGLLAMVNAMLTAGATCAGSSNSVAGAMDGVNRWAAIGNIVWAAAGVAHSWIVLSWANGKQLLIACSTGAGNPHLINIDRGTAAFTAGSATADPTPPTNHVLRSNRQFIRAAYAASHYHWQYSDSQDFIFAISPDAATYPAFGLFEANLANAPSGTTHPYAGFDNWNDGGRGAFRNTALQSGTNLTMFRNSGAVATVPSVIDPSSGGGRVMDLFTSAQVYELVAISAGEMAGGGSSQFNGTLVDIYWCSTGTGCVVGDEVPAVAPQVWQSWGDIMVSDGSVAAIFI